MRVWEQLSELQRQVAAIVAAEHGALNMKYAGKEIAVALSEFLDERGGEADYMDCEVALLNGGCDLKSRPRAVLRTVVTRNPNLFEWRGVRVARVAQRIQPQNARVA
jgi:hypothetical protein